MGLNDLQEMFDAAKEDNVALETEVAEKKDRIAQLESRLSHAFALLNEYDTFGAQVVPIDKMREALT